MTLLFSDGGIMARKTRYMNYYRNALRATRKEKKSTPKSVLGKLKELQKQEFVMEIPIADRNGS